MAGIGFELNRLFDGKSIFSKLRAYGYTAVITTGPMFLGILFVACITGIGGRFGLSDHDRSLLGSMISIEFMATLVFSSFFSLTVTRFIADMLYQERSDLIMPSLRGVLCILLPFGGIPCIVFLRFAGITFSQSVFFLILFLLLLAVWIEMNYLTAIRDYKAVFGGYTLAVGGAVVGALIVSAVWGPTVDNLMASCCFGYGLMVVADLILLHRFFPDSQGNMFLYLKWFDQYRTLAANGVLLNIGLFAHLAIAWYGPWGEKIQGLFYDAPGYDIPALLAFLTTLITTINFVAMTETRFYPTYRDYYGLFNGGAAFSEIDRARKRMLRVLRHEITFVVRIQACVTALSISLGVEIINELPLGFDAQMDGAFIILTIGYGVYIVGNVLMMVLMYFLDDKGAMISSVIFCIIATAGSLLTMRLPEEYLGVAFMMASFAYLMYVWWRLRYFTNHLEYHVLSTQPIVPRPVKGPFVSLERLLDGEVRRERVRKREEERRKAKEQGSAVSGGATGGISLSAYHKSDRKRNAPPPLVKGDTKKDSKK